MRYFAVAQYDDRKRWDTSASVSVTHNVILNEVKNPKFK